MGNALFPPPANRDLGFCKNEASLGLFGVLRPFTTANFCHFLQNRDMVWAASARSGLPWRDLWEVLWEWTRKSLLGKRCDSPIGRALRKFACNSAHRKRVRKARVEKPDHASAIGMDSEEPNRINAIRMNAERVNNQAEWGWGMKSLIGQRQ